MFVYLISYLSACSLNISNLTIIYVYVATAALNLTSSKSKAGGVAVANNILTP